MPEWQKGKYMKKDKIILNDGTVIELEVAASLASLTTIFSDWNTAAQTMPKLTEDNLSNVKVQNGEGLTVGTYTNLIVQPGTWEMKEDGIFITISLREKTDIEKRLDHVEEGQETQDGAIAEIAEMVGGEK